MLLLFLVKMCKTVIIPRMQKVQYVSSHRRE